MKRILLIITIMAVGNIVFGQGALQWGNSFTGFRQQIYAPCPDDPYRELHGISTSTFQPFPLGPLLQGTGWTFSVYIGPAGASSNNLTFLTSTTFRTSTTNSLPAGLVTGGTITVPGVNPGEAATFQIRVWDNQGGTLTRWIDALQVNAIQGASEIVTTAPLGGIDPITGAPVGTPSTVGWTSFNVHWVIPEPSVATLAALGLIAALTLRRRK